MQLSIIYLDKLGRLLSILSIKILCVFSMHNISMSNSSFYPENCWVLIAQQRVCVEFEFDDKSLPWKKRF